jgi:hypothetical protein
MMLSTLNDFKLQLKHQYRYCIRGLRIRKITYTQKTRPKTLAQTVTLVACIRDMPGSNFGRDAILTEAFCSLPWYLQTNAGIVP